MMGKRRSKNPQHPEHERVAILLFFVNVFHFDNSFVCCDAISDCDLCEHQPDGTRFDFVGKRKFIQCENKQCVVKNVHLEQNSTTIQRVVYPTQNNP